MNTTAPALQWIPSGHSPVPIERFGDDHWSTFLYAETRTVDYKGYLGHDQMRCSLHLHGSLYSIKNPHGASDGARYPTRAKVAERQADGTWIAEELPGHDDYSCLDDCITAGLLEVDMPTPSDHTWQTATGDYITPKMVGPGPMPDPARITPRDRKRLMGAARWRVTPFGAAVASQLRQWKADGGNFHDFDPDLDKARQASS